MTSCLLRYAWRLILVGATGTAGIYLVYYLYHWEWVRAQIAGTVLVATLVIGSTFLVLARIDRLEKKVATPTAPPASPGTSRALPAQRRSSEPQFSWLADAFEPPRTHVFIPVLLAAGLVVSIVAGAVERVATATNGGSGAAEGKGLQSQARRTLVGYVLRGAVLLGVVGITVGGLWIGSHYRPVALGEGTTELVVQVDTKSRAVRPASTVETVARYCSLSTGIGVRVQSVQDVAADTATLVVTPLLDEQMQRRYGGCLQDGQVERHRLTVTDAVLRPET